MGQGAPPHLSFVDGKRRDGRERERSTHHDASEAAPTIEEGDGIPGGIVTTAGGRAAGARQQAAKIGAVEAEDFGRRLLAQERTEH